jgi:L-ascorbate metabolism protein UlaG (beta-lactamase superfamily)
MKRFILPLLLFSSLIMPNERFKNTDEDAAGKSFREFLKWSFTNKKPELVAIDSSDEWKELTPSSTDYLVWIGHATYLINKDGLTILTDPVFSKRASPVRFAGPKRLIPPAIPIDKLPKIDVITVSHNHYDHLDLRSLKKIYKANPNAIFLVPKGDKRRLERRGIENVKEFLWWEEIEINGSKFTFTPVQHWSARGIADRNKSLWGGWFMELKTESIYHAGDTGYSDDFIETKKRLGSPSLSLIPVGAYAPRWFMKTNHVNPPEAIQVALDLESKRNFGMHWGTFQLTDEEIMEPPELLKQSLKELGLSEEFFRVLTPGEVVEF